ncbi:MAG: hypothetical protein ACOCY8_03270 [Spirochaetota bacterium]
MNRRYRVKGIAGLETIIDLLAEAPGGYEARITSISEYGVRESYEYIGADLLESCIRTGYLSLVEDEAPLHVAEHEAVLSA